MTPPKRDIDLDSEEGRGRFVRVFDFLNDALTSAVASGASPESQMAQVIHRTFPGTTTVHPSQIPQQYQQPQPQTYQQPQPQYAQAVGQNQQGPAPVVIKGPAFGPIPDWLFEQAASKGVTEVYDNRDKAAQSTKRYPWFRSTTGGDNAPAFWPPR